MNYHSLLSAGLCLAFERFACGRCPVLLLFIALGVTIERALEVSECDDEAGPAIDETALENVVLEERPHSMSKSARHRNPLVGELGDAKRRVAVSLPDHLGEV